MNEREWDNVLASPFMVELRQEAATLEAGGEIMLVNGHPMGRAIWNLLLSRRDLRMWVRDGMKPTRSWKVTDVKRYFGITGSGQRLLDNFDEVFAKLGVDE